ncbi:MAG: type II secretion system protein GspG [Spirochaetales bacterium]|nr:type II secretion system protein GspG [Spirochaetales bacterium]
MLLLSSTVIIPAGGTKGEEAEPFQGIEQEELAIDRMATVQEALEAYKKEYGRYPETKEWLDNQGLLAEYLPHSDLFDPWKRKFHYEAVMKDGEIVNYKLESLGLDPEYPYDNIPCPIDTYEHLFTGEDY